MLKRLIKVVLSGVLIGSLVWIGLRLKEPVKVNSVMVEGFYGREYAFEEVTIPGLLGEDTYFRINAPDDLALLMAINLRNENYTLDVVMNNSISLDKAFAYARSIIPYNFELQIQSKSISYHKVNYPVHHLVIRPLEDERQLYRHAADWRYRYMTGESLRHDLRSVHDEIIYATRYDSEYASSLNLKADHPSHRASGVFEHGLAVCDGYARAFHSILEEAEVPAFIVTSFRMNHAWNLVYDDGWYYVDVTFDDPVPDRAGQAYHRYFMIKPQDFNSKVRPYFNHQFDDAGADSLSEEEIFEFAYRLFPDTQK